MVKMRYLVALLGLVAVVAVGWRGYVYFFDTTTPFLEIIGVDQDRYYSGEMACWLQSNKSGDVSLFLDGQLLAERFSICGKQEYPFVIPTQTVANGKHTVSLQLIDHQYHKNKVSVAKDFFVDNVPLQVAFVRPDQSYQVLQGRTFHIQFQTNKEIEKGVVSVLSHDYECYPESRGSLIYEAFIPISCQENPSEYLFSIQVLDKVGNTVTLHGKLQVMMFPFKKQVLQVSDEKVQQELALGEDNARFEELLKELSAASVHEKMWKGTFCAPIDIDRITCDFGVIRTTKHKGRYSHNALDIISAPKSVVWASQAGTVVLKERFGFNGNTVVIDHGLGVLSLYCHLDDFANIKVGDHIAQGNPIGTLGKTGYASGYHLHWEMRVNNIQVDPMQWTKPTF